MPTQLTAEDARQSLNEHVKSKALDLRAKFGPHLGWLELQRALQDRSCVRYPCEIVFDSAKLQPGELAYPMPKGEGPEAGFMLFVHPLLMVRVELVPHVVLYQLVLVNYGEAATAEDAETFGATALGLAKDAYYQTLCQLADEIAGEDSGQ
jgi:hypothetical protein